MAIGKRRNLGGEVWNVQDWRASAHNKGEYKKEQEVIYVTVEGLYFKIN